ncbi:MAG: hypothetical protein IT236_01155 [Bacteroidia bacterium]|nr:hypothetical protein [Bacteroidia bacterium]
MKTFQLIKASLSTALVLLSCLTLLAANPEKPENVSAASVPPPAPGCNLPISVTKDLVADFGAFGNGIYDDSPAFKRASNWINANWSTSSSIKITVPAGTYLVGKQLKRGETWNYGTGSVTNPAGASGHAYLGIRVFELLQAKNVIIEGAPGMATKIVYKNGLKYGGYRTDTELPCNARNAGCANQCQFIQSDVASVGTFLYMDRCSCVSASNFWVEGHYNMCDRKGNVGECSTIQLEYDGVLIAGGSDIAISDITCANFGRDGMMSYYTTNSNVTNLTLNNFVASGNGRNGYSLVSGANVSATNCDFVLSGLVQDGAIYSGDPQAGLDIEPDQGGTVNNASFLNCRFTKNHSYAFTTNGYYPSNITFDNCLFSAREGYALWPSGMNNSIIKNSTIFGKMVHVLGGGPGNNLVFDNNNITDWFGNWQTTVKPIWALTPGGGHYLLDFGDPTGNLYYSFTNNTINLHHSFLIFSAGVPNPTTDRLWDSNTFNFFTDDMYNTTNGHPQLWQGNGFLGHFKSCALNSNQFIDVQPDPIPNTGVTYVISVNTGQNSIANCTTDGLNYWGPTGPGAFTFVKYNPAWLMTWLWIDGNW